MRRAARQYHERGLKGVVGVVRATGDAAAHREHHRPVAAHDLREGVFVARGNEPRDEFAVRHVRCAEHGPDQLPHQRARVFGPHALVP